MSRSTLDEGAQLNASWFWADGADDFGADTLYSLHLVLNAFTMAKTTPAN